MSKKLKTQYQLTKRNFCKVSLAGLMGTVAFPSLFADILYAAPANAKGKRTLVAYFSMPETDNPINMTQEEENSTVVIDGKVLGNTQYLAYVIKDTLGATADLFRIEPQIPYTTDHKKLIEQAKNEQNKNYRPPLKSMIENLDLYDIIFLGYPTWWYKLPMVLYTFLEQHDLSGKTIIPFNTHGGSSFSDTIETIALLQPNAIVRTDGISISRDRIQNAHKDIVKWVNMLK